MIWEFPHTDTSGLTTSYYAPSGGWSTRNMTNRPVHHLISTKLHCAPPKCTSVQNYIVNLDLNVINMCTVHHVEQSVCRLSLWPSKYRQKVSIFCMFHVHHQKIKNVGVDPYFSKTLGLLVHHGAKCRLVVHNAQHNLQKPRHTDRDTHQRDHFYNLKRWCWR